MAAPFFYSAALLTADLESLGYPHMDDPKLLSVNGPSRITLLTWLAEQIDPTAKLQTPEKVAAFWQTVGVHSTEPTSAGHRIPFTCPNRPRDRPAALAFLRAAIDLTLSICRQRQENTRPIWADPHLSDKQDANRGQEGSPKALLNAFDIESFTQLDALIAQRHVLFPTSAKLLSTHGSGKSKRSVQSQRRLSTMSSSKIPSPRKRNLHSATTSPYSRRSLRQSKGNATVDKVDPSPRKVRSPSKIMVPRVPPREHVLERLRTLRSELTEFKTTSEALVPVDEKPETEQNDSATVKQLVAIALALSNRAQQLNDLFEEAQKVRESHGWTATRDKSMEKTLSSAIPQCLRLWNQARATVSATARVRGASDALRRAKAMLQSLPECTAVRAVGLQHLRTEWHLL